MATCPRCGAKLIRDVVRKGSRRKLYKNYRCPKCGERI